MNVTPKRRSVLNGPAAAGTAAGAAMGAVSRAPGAARSHDAETALQARSKGLPHTTSACNRCTASAGACLARLPATTELGPCSMLQAGAHRVIATMGCPRRLCQMVTPGPSKDTFVRFPCCRRQGGPCGRALGHASPAAPPQHQFHRVWFPCTLPCCNELASAGFVRLTVYDHTSGHTNSTRETCYWRTSVASPCCLTRPCSSTAQRQSDALILLPR